MVDDDIIYPYCHSSKINKLTNSNYIYTFFLYLINFSFGNNPKVIA